MNSILRNIISILIVGIFILIPITLFFNQNYVFLGILLLIIYLSVTQKKGWSILILALVYCLPYSGGLSDENLKLLSDVMWLPYNIIRIIIVFVFIQYFCIHKIKNPIITKGFVLFSILIIVGIFYSINTNNYNEIIDLLTWFIFTYLTIYITQIDKIDLKSFLLYIDVIFYCTIFHVILEFVFHNSPYQVLYENFKSDSEIQAKGLLGHPLVLSSFLTLYQVTLYCKAILYKKFPYFNFVLLLIIGLMTASRTNIILFAIAFMYYYISEGKYKLIINNIKLILLSIISLLIIKLSFYNYVDNTIERFETGSTSHRIGAYDVAFKVFKANPWGVGITNFKNEISNTNYGFSILYDKDLPLLDNLYLTYLCQYGLFSIFYLLLYFYPIFYYRKFITCRENFNTYKVMTLLYLIWFLQNFSFDTGLYSPINYFFFFLVAILGNNLKPQKTNK